MITLLIALAIGAILLMVITSGIAIRDIDEELCHQRMLISQLQAEIQIIQKGFGRQA